MELLHWKGGVEHDQQWGTRERYSTTSSSSLVHSGGRGSTRSSRTGDLGVEVIRKHPSSTREMLLLGNSRQLKTVGMLYCSPEPSTLLAIAQGGTDRRSCGSLATRRQFRTAALGLGLSREEAQLYPRQINAAKWEQQLHLLTLFNTQTNECGSPTLLKWLLVLTFFVFESSISVLIFFSKDGLRSSTVELNCQDKIDGEDCTSFRCAGMCDIESIGNLCPRTCKTCTADCIAEDTWVSLTGGICNDTNFDCDFQTVHTCNTSTLEQSIVSDEYVNADVIYIYDSCSTCGECSSDITHSGEYPFRIGTLVFVVEACKFIFFGLILLSKGICRRPEQCFDFWVFAILAPLDVGAFFLKILTLKYLTPSQFAVLFNVDIVLAAVLVRFVKFLNIMRSQYLGILIILIGVSQLLVWNEELQENTKGILFVFLAALVSCVWNFLAECHVGSKSLDESKLGALQKMFISTSFSLVASGILVVVQDPADLLTGNFSEGLTPGAWALAVILVCYEICLLIIKDMLNLFTVAVITALTIPCTLALDQLIFSANDLTAAECFSAAVVMSGVLLFNCNHLGFVQHLREEHIQLLFPVKEISYKNHKSNVSTNWRSLEGNNSKRKRDSYTERGELSIQTCTPSNYVGSSKSKSKSTRPSSSSRSPWERGQKNQTREIPQLRSNVPSISDLGESDDEVFISPREGGSDRARGGLKPEYFFSPGETK